MILLRSLLFDFCFYIGTALISLGGTPLLLLPKRFGYKVTYSWCVMTNFFLRHIVGLNFRVEGEIPEGPYLIACKHQSAWETIVFFSLLKEPCIIQKQELGWIPIVNLYMKRLGFIFLNRKAGMSALKHLLRKAQLILEQGRPLLIFPEGTRSTPGQPGVYQAGVAAMYTHLNVPVIPVALNSGVFWGRRSFLKKPGMIVLRFLPPIEPGLSRKDFMTTLAHSLDSESDSLLPPEYLPEKP